MLAVDRASRAWPILVERAREKDTITYGQLAEEIGGIPRYNLHLKKIENYCKENNIPGLNALVVNGGTGMPGEGCLPEDLKRIYDFDWDSLKNPFLPDS